MGSDGETRAAHLFAQSGDLTVYHASCGVRGDVAGRYPGAAAGDDEVESARIGPLHEERFDLKRFVRDHGCADDLGASGGKPFLKSRPAGVDPLPPRTFVTQYQYCSFHNSSSR